MGRKLLLTVRKCRSNERQKLKDKKVQKLKLAKKASEIKRVYGGPLDFINTHHNVNMTSNTTNSASDTATAGVSQLMDAKDDDANLPNRDINLQDCDIDQPAVDDINLPDSDVDRPDADLSGCNIDLSVPGDATIHTSFDLNGELLVNSKNVTVDYCEGPISPISKYSDTEQTLSISDEDNSTRTLIEHQLDDGLIVPYHESNELHDNETDYADINLQLPCNVSIDLAPLDWTFQHELPDLESIAMDTEMAYIQHNAILGQTSSESNDHQTLSTLKYTLQYSEPIRKWFVLPTDDTSNIHLCTYNFNAALSPVITFAVEIQFSYEWVLHIPFGVLNWKCHPVFKDLPIHLMSRNDVKEITDTIDDCKQCEGISDKKFDILVTKHRGKFFDFSGKKLLAFYDIQYSTIRHVNCLWLCDSHKMISQCNSCFTYQRNVLNSALVTASNKLQSISPGRSSVQSHTNYRFCSTPEKLARLSKLHHTVRLQNKALERLKNKLHIQITSQSLKVEEPVHNDLVMIMQTHSKDILSKYGEESFQFLFWSQQLKAATTTSCSGRRWHPLIIKWCLYLYHVSRKAYETIRNSGVITLPSSRTLRDYKHLSATTVGFSIEADRQLVDILAQKDDLAKYGMLLFDEMYVKQGLVFEKSTGALFGFTDLGELNNQLDEFEKHLSGDSTGLQRPLAKTMLVFMFKGLFTNVAMPYAQFPAASLKGSDIFPLLWEAIGRLNRTGCCVLGVTCDASSPNRRLFQLHQMPDTPKTKIVHKAVNMFNSDSRKPAHILFFTDPPHLLKTIRNCFENPTRKLWCNGRDIKWQHIVDLYERNTGKVTQTPGLSMAHKLKYEHIKLTNFSKMRVDLAAQVLSASVSKALKLTGGDEAVETAKFIELVDKFFDCLNVSSLSKGKQQRKEFAMPYRKPDDIRIKFLRDELLPYFDQWEKSVESRPGFSKEQRNLMLLSRESRHGITISVSSFLELYSFIFSIAGVSCFLSNRICQDPLEKYFGMQRQSGGTNDNPTIMEFAKNSETLRLVGNMWFDDAHGNCRKSNSVKQCIEDTKALPLRKRQRKAPK